MRSRPPRCHRIRSNRSSAKMALPLHRVSGLSAGTPFSVVFAWGGYPEPARCDAPNGSHALRRVLPRGQGLRVLQVSYFQGWGQRLLRYRRPRVPARGRNTAVQTRARLSRTRRVSPILAPTSMCHSGPISCENIVVKVCVTFFSQADDNTGIQQPRPGHIQNTDLSHFEMVSRPRNMHPFGARRAVISGK